MIGVLCPDAQLPVVEEFFELFKTPWQRCAPGRVYDVVITTQVDGPLPEARVVLAFAACGAQYDSSCGITVEGPRQRAPFTCGPTQLPIFGELVTFRQSPTQHVVGTVRGSAAALGLIRGGSTVIRLGYDLFAEIEHLLSQGQPVEHAESPTIDTHIDLLRRWIVGAGVPLLEIGPSPAGHDFSVCLTHDIDFIGIRQHKLDHSMWGFVYRATVGAARNFARRRLSIARLLRAWWAVVSLPLVYLGLLKDFWEPFGWYAVAEAGLPATYYLIPYKRRAGEHVPGRAAHRRGTAYDVADVTTWATRLVENGCEVGVHGIDAWHDDRRGRDEMRRVSGVVGGGVSGIRMHWLLQKADTPTILERAGFKYDSTAGYNETIGFRNGTAQVFKPLGARTLLELPMHIQDGALFYPQRLDLSEPEAETRCGRIIDQVRHSGGVVTILWHDRSHGPERFWGEFYVGLIDRLKLASPWFATGGQLVQWFAARRATRFHEEPDGVLAIVCDAGESRPGFRVRVYPPGQETGGLEGTELTYVDVPWNGEVPLTFDGALRPTTSLSRHPSVTAAVN